MSLDKLAQKPFSIGVELPLDNDWARFETNTSGPFGIPDMRHHEARIQLADKMGFFAAWVRDVPIYDPNFGDAAQVFETFSYLGYLAAKTERIMLGSAAVVLPLRQPWLVKKAAATIQSLSKGRLILGLASGDRPSEYPLFNIDFPSRGARFQEAVAVLKGEPKRPLQAGQKVLPELTNTPLYVAGLAQQSPMWVGQNMDGWLAYPGTPEDHKKRVAQWRNVAGEKPYVSFIHLNLLDEPDAPITRHRFGIETGVNGLITELKAMQQVGVNHIGLHFRRNTLPVEWALEYIGKQVLPHFHF
ncbi:LLM class flavin-dependent oxidoreductase [Pseudoalteromonas ruthenica]|uniref:TIGR03571 family LLM class oxidoreductase n=1 Tax=Pseudoalteromonas ruthenica TaxID=151081 RepID=UPI0011095FB2|nr:TIGR03571 family LLM class oxidoreductase [Pseudoalteromonas ruthenica]TLX51717.1 LLM class flavin-dependent oxidoreductase [Pseudoalteromonas ruthenica]